MEHPGKTHVEAVGDAAGDDLREVYCRGGLAHVPEILGVLERGLLRQVELRGSLDELSVAEPAAARLVNHGALLRAALRCRNAPPFRRRGDEDRSRRRSGLPQVAPGVTNAAAASGELVQVLRIEAVGLADLDRLPIDGELFRDHHGERRLDSSADLRARREDRHGAVGLDLDERPQRGSRVFRPGRPRKRDEQAAGRRRADLEERPAIEGGPRAHFFLVARPAARWIALRMRGYVPHRQMFPDIASSISASVGFGRNASRDAAVMICPGWQ